MKKSNSKNKKKTKAIKKTLRILGTIIFSLILVVIITGSILATALTVYVMKFMDSSDAIELDKSQFDYSTFIYAKDKDGVFQPIESLSNGEKRVWVSIDKVPQMVQDAFIYTEDERFYNHDGVDFKRTFSAFANMFLHFYSTEQGASTITQQLVRNITGDNEVNSNRKIREIFRSMNLEKAYPKPDILEAYLNIVPQGGTITGIQAAANFYFDKDISEVTIAEAACLAALPKDPPKYQPINHPEANKARREYVLYQMYNNGAISTDEYESALKEDIKFVGYNKLDDEGNVTTHVTSYFTDAVIEQAIHDFMELYGLSYENAETKLKSGGYKIYSTVDTEIQSQLEAKYEDPLTFSSEVLENPPQSASIIMDYSGNVLGVVGGIGEKTESRTLNRATQSTRSPGSCIKPIASYAPAISLGVINWSTPFIDQPLQVPNKDTGVMEDFKVLSPSTGNMEAWPKNYTPGYSRKDVLVYEGLKKSLNTVAAQIVQKITPQVSYDFLKDKLHITTLDPQDIDKSPMSVGGLTNGLILEELVASYQIFGNLGKYNSPTFYSKITDSNDNIVIEHKYISQQALDSSSAYIMNRLMKGVIDGGTGTKAKVGIDCELVGKTGTSQDWGDILFVGCTPDYVSGMWYGYDIKANTQNTYYASSAQVWNNIFKDIINTGTTKTFEKDPDVIEQVICAETGNIATEACPVRVAGYYKKSDLPPICTKDHAVGTSTTP